MPPARAQSVPADIGLPIEWAATAHDCGEEGRQRREHTAAACKCSPLPVFGRWSVRWAVLAPPLPCAITGSGAGPELSG